MTSINAEKLRARDEQALSELFKELIPTLRKAAWRFHPDIDPDEVVAEALFRLMQDTDRLADLAASGKLEVYCHILARNTAHHLLHRSAIQKRISGELKLPETVELEPSSEQQLQRLKKALDSLASADRDLIHMYYLQEKTPDEVAQNLGVSKNALRIKVHRARARLMKALELEGGASK